jgi:hypothetical protein
VTNTLAYWNSEEITAVKIVVKDIGAVFSSKLTKGHNEIECLMLANFKAWCINTLAYWAFLSFKESEGM